MPDVSVSVVIPTFNMGAHLASLWAELHTSGLVGRVREIIVVDDGSTDTTADIVNAFIARTHNPATRFRSVRLPANRGRFGARLEGARAATSEFLLFLDTRLNLPAAFADRLFTYLPGDRCLQGLTRLDATRSVYDLYWERTHSWLFRRHYRDAERDLVITAENYDRYLKGTTVFACPAEAFLAACQSFGDTDPQNDDTALLAEIVRTHPIHVRADFEYYWFPRRTLREFLARLWERGPSFVEYHLFERRGIYFALIACAFLALIGEIALVAALSQVSSLTGRLLATLALVLDISTVALTAAFFARSAREFVRLAPLHVLVVGVAGATVLRSTAVELARRISGRRRRTA